MAIRRGGRLVPAKRTKKLPRKITRRRGLPASEFVFPTKRRYPLPDAYHATLALGALLRVAGRHGVSESGRESAAAVLEAVRKRFPGVYRGEADLVSEVRSVYSIGRDESREARRGRKLDEIMRRHRVR